MAGRGKSRAGTCRRTRSSRAPARARRLNMGAVCREDLGVLVDSKDSRGWTYQSVEILGSTAAPEGFVVVAGLKEVLAGGFADGHGLVLLGFRVERAAREVDVAEIGLERVLAVLVGPEPNLDRVAVAPC